MGSSSARSEATSAAMIAFVSRPVARPPIDCVPAPFAVWISDEVVVGSVVVVVGVVGFVDVELPIDVIHSPPWLAIPSRQRRRPAFPRRVGELPPPRLRMSSAVRGPRTDRLIPPLLEELQSYWRSFRTDWGAEFAWASMAC